MVQINFHSREVNCKIVFYGPGRSGKTTNLEVVHRKAPKDSVGEMVSIATEQDRTLYFDFLPLNLGMVAGMTTKFQLYTVPGQVYYNETRKLVLQGTDGVVFVADSHPDMEQENLSSLTNLVENLRENGIDIAELPLVLQYNKRDLPNALSIEKLDAVLNKWGAPTVPAVAISDEKSVFKTLKLVSSLVIKKLNRQNGTGDPNAEEPADSSASAAAVSAAPPAAPPPLMPPPMAPAPAVAASIPRPAPVAAPVAPLLPPPQRPPMGTPPSVGSPAGGSGMAPRPMMSIPQVPRPSGPLAVARTSGPVAIPPMPQRPPMGGPAAPPPPPRPAMPPPMPSAPPPAAMQAPASVPMQSPMAPMQSNAPSAQMAQQMANAVPTPAMPAQPITRRGPANPEAMQQAINAGGAKKGNGLVWGIIVFVIVAAIAAAAYFLTV